MLHLRTDSLHSRAYQWFYAQSKDDLPKNLCPYFWKLAIMLTLIVPYSILSLPAILMFELNTERLMSGERLFRGIFIYLGLYMLFAIGVAISAIWVTYESFMKHTADFGTLVLTLVTLILVCKFFFYLLNYINYNNYRAYRKKKPNLVVEFAKAKYNKLCPRIEWRSSDDKV